VSTRQLHGGRWWWVVCEVEFAGSTPLQYPDGTVKHYRHRQGYGETAHASFLEFLMEVREVVAAELWGAYDKEMEDLTAEEEAAFDHELVCMYCNLPVTVDDAVHDHSHLTGRYRGKAHMLCNLLAGRVENSPRWQRVPVIFHNFRGSDAHLIMQGIGQQAVVDEQYEFGNVSVIAESAESYKQLAFKGFVFVDSNQLMPGALASHVKELPDDCKVMLRAAVEGDAEKFALINQKGEFPYDWFDGFDKLHDTALPPREAWYNKLTQEHLTDAEWARAQAVWQLWDCGSFGDYLDVYLAGDVCGLADVFEYFRREMHAEFGVDPVQYVSAASLSWQAMLRHTGVEIPLLQDIDQHLFMERGIRGGLAVVATRHSQASGGEYECFEPTVQQRQLFYFDCNSLYGYAMSKPLPLDGFAWVPEEEWGRVGLVREGSTGWQLGEAVHGEGFVAEVDLEYPAHLHAQHDDYPLAPVKLSITEGMISPHSKAVPMAGGSSQLRSCVLPWMGGRGMSCTTLHCARISGWACASLRCIGCCGSQRLHGWSPMSATISSGGQRPPMPFGPAFTSC